MKAYDYWVLIEHLKSCSANIQGDFGWEEIRKAISFAEQKQEWDFLVELGDRLLQCLLFSPFALTKVAQNDRTIARAKIEWQLCKEIAQKSISISRLNGKKNKEIALLEKMSRLALLLNDNQLVLNCINQLEELISDDTKWSLAYQIGTLAIQIQPSRDSLIVIKQMLQKRLRILEDIHDFAGVADTLNWLGDIEFNQNNYKKSKCLLQESIKFASQSNHKLIQVKSMWKLSQIHKAENNRGQAKALLKDANSILLGQKESWVHPLRMEISKELEGVDN